jgi:hypothetical protein
MLEIVVTGIVPSGARVVFHLTASSWCMECSKQPGTVRAAWPAGWVAVSIQDSYETLSNSKTEKK